MKYGCRPTKRWYQYIILCVVFLSQVKFRDRTPRGSILGSEAPSECGSLYDSEPLFTIKQGLKPQQGAQSISHSSLSLPTVVGAGASGYSGDGSTSSLPTLSESGKNVGFILVLCFAVHLNFADQETL